jgi:class 3 adenylate cyclase
VAYLAAVDLDALRDAGLYDPDASDAAQRRELLEYLDSLGTTLDEIREAAASGTLLTLATRRVLMPEHERLTLAEAADRAGVDPDVARRVRIAAGLPDPGDDAVIWPGEVEVYRSFASGSALVGPDPSMQFGRVLGAAAAAIAEGAIAMFVAADPPGRRKARSPAAIARIGVEATHTFLELPAMLDALLRINFEHALARVSSVEAGGLSVGAHFAIGFIDLDSSTSLVNLLDDRELAAAMADFERLATEAAVGAGGRIVKMIGDEAMLVAPYPAGAVEGAARLVEAVGLHPVLRGARAAVSYGPVVPRDGDYFGAVVNLAARLVAEAETGEVMVTAEVARELPAGAVLARGTRRVRGFDETVDVFARPARELSVTGASRTDRAE